MDPRATGIKPAAVVAPHGTSSCPWCSSFWSSLVGSSLRCPYAETCSCKLACFATESDTTIICMTYPNLSSNDCGFNCMVFCMQLFGDRCSCHQILWLEVVLFFWQYNYQVLLFFNHNYLVQIFGHQIYLKFQMFFLEVVVLFKTSITLLWGSGTRHGATRMQFLCSTGESYVLLIAKGASWRPRIGSVKATSGSTQVTRTWRRRKATQFLLASKS